jgi:hypothetical protein
MIVNGQNLIVSNCNTSCTVQQSRMACRPAQRVVSSSCGAQRMRYRDHSLTAALRQIAHTSQPRTHLYKLTPKRAHSSIPTASPRYARRGCSGRSPPRRRSPGRLIALLRSCARPPWRHDRWRTCELGSQHRDQVYKSTALIQN